MEGIITHLLDLEPRLATLGAGDGGGSRRVFHRNVGHGEGYSVGRRGRVVGVWWCWR